jgi:hypothetical protein
MSFMRSFRLVVEALSTIGRQRLALLALLAVVGALFAFALLASLVSLLWRRLGIESAADAGTDLLFVGAVLAAGVIRFALLAYTQRLVFECRSGRCS